MGSYKRTFSIPKNWNGRRILIHFAGVDSAFTLWVNGKEVGYSEGSRTPAEFDITPFLVKGKNDLAVEVIRFSTGAWLEDQDMWRLSGIFRDVELISQPAGERLRDFFLKTPLDSRYVDATLDLTCSFENPKEGSVGIVLLDEKGAKILSANARIIKGVATFKKPVKAPKLWSAETPHLYTLFMAHYNAAGKVVEVIPWRFGFRWSEMKNNRQLINGKPAVIAGVNRHEHSDIHGHYCTLEEMRKDVIQMKQLNFNAIRTSHYANAPELYALCNEYGLYVNAEANIESHGSSKNAQHPYYSLRLITTECNEWWSATKTLPLLSAGRSATNRDDTVHTTTTTPGRKPAIRDPFVISDTTKTAPLPTTTPPFINALGNWWSGQKTHRDS